MRRFKLVLDSVRGIRIVYCALDCISVFEGTLIGKSPSVIWSHKPECVIVLPFLTDYEPVFSF